MRAAYYEAFGGPENVLIGERPDSVPDAQHMLVRTRAAGVGIWDVGILSSTVGRAVPPTIPGGDAPLPRIRASKLRGRSRSEQPGSAPATASSALCGAWAGADSLSSPP